MKKQLLILSLAVLGFTACKKDVKNENPANPQSAVSVPSNTAAREGDPIILTGDILNFKTQEDFDNLIVSMEDSQTAYSRDGFTSLYTVFSQVVDAENLAANNFIAQYATPDEANEHSSEFQHSSVYTSNLPAIREAIFEDGSGSYFNMNLFSATIAKVVNKYGFVIIEDKLYRYTYDYIYNTEEPFDEVSAFTLSNTRNNGQLDNNTKVTGPNPGGGNGGGGGGGNDRCQCVGSFKTTGEATGLYIAGITHYTMKNVLEVSYVQQNFGAFPTCLTLSNLVITGSHFVKILAQWMPINASGMSLSGSYTANSTPSQPIQWTPLNTSFSNISSVSKTHFVDLRNPSVSGCLYLSHINYFMFSSMPGGSGSQGSWALSGPSVSW